jgi:hypothetical protein
MLQREDELKEWRNETERQLQVVREKNEQLHVEVCPSLLASCLRLLNTL